MAGSTQRRLMKEFGITTDSGPVPQVASSKKLPPVVAPKPVSYSKDINSSYTHSISTKSEFPPPPTSLYSGGGDQYHGQSKNDYSSATYQNTSDFPPPPSFLTNPAPNDGNSYQKYIQTDANRYNPSLQRASPQPVTMSYQTTSSRPTYSYGSHPTTAYQNQNPNQSVHSRPAAPTNYYSNAPVKSTPSSMPMNTSNMRPTDVTLTPASRSPAPPVIRQKSVTENEVDALTNLLLQNLEATSEPDFYGTCNKCKCSVLGEQNGCTAMDTMYHVDCFTCQVCDRKLKGLPFFALENEPYCEGCYMNTLEKCSVCARAITDRILRATGKPYHPECFTCVVCRKSLDGIPFTVDATNKVHCIEDFHKKFAPRCCVCHLPIMPEDGQEETVRVVAMDRSFHVHCYKCEDCGMVLSSEAEGRGCYPLDNHILCKNCNTNRIQAMTHQMTTEL